MRKAAWKTGTSYGFRDAWAVGMTPAYTIGVWVGNADGHGVPGLTGARTAGPVLFDILNLLPYDDAWFAEPDGVSPSTKTADSVHGKAKNGVPSTKMADSVHGKAVWAAVCTDSGMLAGPECPKTELLIPAAGLDSEPCPYHNTGEFVLPPAMEWYYKPHHPEYKGSTRAQTENAVQFIYPQNGAVLAIPRQLGGEKEGVVFRAAHHSADATLWWHLDNSYVGETRFRHELLLARAPGKHTLTVVDGEGNTASIRFTVAE